MPKQNRPLVRDGRLQSNKKKRTDRSYLRPGGAAATPEVAELPEAVVSPPDADDLPSEPAPQSPAAGALDAFRAPEPPSAEPVAAPPAGVPAPGARLPSTVRALQQQGVRKRREVDIAQLQRRDSDYALHELRRIFTLAAMVVITLVVLTIVLR